MTATNMCSNFGGFMSSLPSLVSIGWIHLKYVIPTKYLIIDGNNKDHLTGCGRYG